MTCLAVAIQKGALPFQIQAARKKRSSPRKQDAAVACPVKPPSLFVKRSPVPSRRPLRGVPFMDLVEAAAMEPSIERKSIGSYPVEVEEQGKVSSKWASLFEAASTSRYGSSSSGESQQDQSSKDADAWFDKIFPKNINHGKDGGDGTSSSPGAAAAAGTTTSSFTAPKLSAQQEKSIQQLQTLVKTLGVATRSPPPPVRRNKPGNKMVRQLPRQGSGGGGGVVDPVPFSSILKKLQSVSSTSIPPATFSSAAAARLEESKSAVDDDEDEEEEEEAIDEESSGEETDSETGSENDEAGGVEVLQQLQPEEQIVASSSTSKTLQQQDSIDQNEDLSKLTVLSLRSIAKARGLSGYSKMKKNELIELLR